MAEVITSFVELQRRLDALPEVAPGHQRVFRGQNQDHGSMLPTGRRSPPQARDIVWAMYAKMLARRVQDQDNEDDLAEFLLWVEAIKQHYGPGSNYLDVTHSPEIAAWFALHRTTTTPVQPVFGPEGPFKPATDVIGDLELVGFEAFDEPAYLYVFDVPVPESLPSLEHGALVDLADAPAVFSSSPRIRAQQACLVYGDETHDGDLSQFFVSGTPLRVAWPLDGCAQLDLASDELFPAVDEDAWYRRFVSLPLAPKTESAAEVTRFEHPIRVSLYAPPEGPQRDAQTEALLQRVVCLQPPLLFADMLQRPAPGDDDFWSLLQLATPVYVEGPFRYATPPIGHPTFNVGVFQHAWGDSVPVEGADGVGPIDRASLHNVFLELSALDTVGWETMEEPGGEMEVLRAIWLVRHDDRVLMTLFRQHMPSTQEQMIGPIPIHFNATRNRFEFVGSGGESKPLAEISPLDELLFKALILVRALDRRWQLAPFAMMQTGEGDNAASLVQILWATARLVRIESGQGPASLYHVLREWGNDRVFYGGVGNDSPAVGGAVQLTGKPYAEFAMPELQQTIDELAARPPLD